MSADTAVMVYDKNTGEELQAVVPETATKIELYKGASKLKLKPEESAALLADFDSEEVEIRPNDGLIYLPQAFFRDRLNRALGLGQWALIEINTGIRDNWLIFDGALFIRGTFVARATGEAQYHANNAKISWASTKESAKSDCIVRCCKDLSIASKLWQPAFARTWVAEKAVQIWNQFDKPNDKGKKGEFVWRRKDAPPFWWEKKQNKNSNPDPDGYDQTAGATMPEKKPEAKKAAAKPSGKVESAKIETNRGGYGTEDGVTNKGTPFVKVFSSAGEFYCRDAGCFEFLKNPPVDEITVDYEVDGKYKIIINALPF